MAAQIPATEPATIQAGDTVTWTKSFADYAPSEGYVLSYALRLENGAGLLNLTATTSGSEFSTTITGASSSLMTPGLWRWASYVTLAGARTSVATGLLTVQPNLAALDSTVDLRSPAKVAYDNALEAWATFAKAKTVSLNGRLYTARDARDLIQYVNQCKADYEAELKKEQFAQTGLNPRRIGIRLTRV